MPNNEDNAFNPSFSQKLQKEVSMNAAIDDVSSAVDDTDDQLDEINCSDASMEEMDAHIVQLFSEALKQMSLAELHFAMETYGDSLYVLIEQEMQNRNE